VSFNLSCNHSISELGLPTNTENPGKIDVCSDGQKTRVNVDNVVDVPEPLTILGAVTAAGFGAFFKRKLAQSKKK
jgi:hypothetical protein